MTRVGVCSLPCHYSPPSADVHCHVSYETFCRPIPLNWALRLRTPTGLESTQTTKNRIVYNLSPWPVYNLHLMEHDCDFTKFLRSCMKRLQKGHTNLCWSVPATIEQHSQATGGALGPVISALPLWFILLENKRNQFYFYSSCAEGFDALRKTLADQTVAIGLSQIFLEWHSLCSTHDLKDAWCQWIISKVQSTQPPLISWLKHVFMESFLVKIIVGSIYDKVLKF